MRPLCSFVTFPPLHYEPVIVVVHFGPEVSHYLGIYFHLPELENLDAVVAAAVVGNKLRQRVATVVSFCPRLSPVSLLG